MSGNDFFLESSLWDTHIVKKIKEIINKTETDMENELVLPKYDL